MVSKALILEIGGGWATVLTKDGEFKRIRATRRIKVGEEIEMPKPRITAFKAAAAVLIVLTVAALWHSLAPMQETAFALSLDINPSLELLLDGESQVVGTRALNSDGQELLRSTSIHGLNAVEAVKVLLVAAKNQGYLQADGENVILFGLAEVSEQAKQAAEMILREAEAAAEETLARERITAVVGSVVVSRETRQEAEKKGISPAGYAVMQRAQAQGLNIDEEAIRNEGIGRAVKSAGGDIRNLVGARNERQEKNQGPKDGNRPAKDEQNGKADEKGAEPQRDDRPKNNEQRDNGPGNSERQGSSKPAGNPGAGGRPDEHPAGQRPEKGQVEPSANRNDSDNGERDESNPPEDNPPKDEPEQEGTRPAPPAQTDKQDGPDPKGPRER